MFVVVCYDIPDDKRRNRISHILEGYGERVQFSVFECDLKTEFVKGMKNKIQKVIKKEDTVRYYYLCADCIARVEVVNGLPVTHAQLYFTV
jgi:CRISPR-associated protein Cas2